MPPKSRNNKLVVILLIVVGLSACIHQQSTLPSLHESFETPLPSETQQAASALPTKRSTATPDVTSSLTPSSTATLTPSPSPTTTLLPYTPQVSSAGIEIHSINQLDAVDDIGAYWLRRNAVLWSNVEAIEGVRNWDNLASLEKELLRASSDGKQLILIVRGTPDWAQKVPGSICGPIREESLVAFADFMYELVLRYSISPYNVKYWELGNEPDVLAGGIPSRSPFGCWGDAGDLEYYGGGYYADMLRVVYPQIKAADSQAQVLIGGLLLDCDPVNPPELPPGSGHLKDCTPARFLQGVLENGGGDYFDGVSFHAYDYYYGVLGQYGNENWHSSWDITGPVILAKAIYLRNLLAAYGYSEKYLMNTEGALLCGRKGTEPPCLVDDFANTKAYYLVQSFTLARILGLRTNIWFDLDGWRGSGLVDEDGTPLQAYHAMKYNISLLDGTSYRSEISDYSGVVGAEFYRDGVRIWVIWSRDGEPHTIKLHDTPDTVNDVYGDILPSDQEIVVTLAPVYIAWHDNSD